MRNPIPGAWRIPSLLIGLSLVPFAATANRLVWIISGDIQPDPNMARFDSAWSPLIVHILTGTLFLILAAVQFSPELRARYRPWQRGAGKIAMLAGIAAGLSGIWLVAAGPLTPQSATALISLGFALNIALGEACIRARRRAPFTYAATE